MRHAQALGRLQRLEPGGGPRGRARGRRRQDAALFAVAAFTGLRMGELRALRWVDVDFANRNVLVRGNYTRGPLATPKSGKVRSVPLIDQAGAALDGVSRREHFTEPGDLVFPSDTGSYFDDGDVRKRFYAALKRAGLGDKRSEQPPMRFHHLRHTFGTLAVQVWPLHDVQAYMGHANVQTTMLYAHHVPSTERRTRSRAWWRVGPSSLPSSSWMATVVEIAPAIAAVASLGAATASWLSVATVRKQWRISQTPHLHVQPILESDGLTIHVSNAGPGVARQPAFAVAIQGRLTGGWADPARMLLSAGQSIMVKTELHPGVTREAHIVAVCLDVADFPHIWDNEGTHWVLRTRILKRARTAPLAKDALQMMHPELKVDEMEYVRGSFPKQQRPYGA